MPLGPQMVGKTCIVTGASRGIGFYTARGLAMKGASAIHFFFAISPEEGAETPIYLASSPDVEGVSGKYFVGKEPVRSSPASYDEETARRLWAISEEMTRLEGAAPEEPPTSN